MRSYLWLSLLVAAPLTGCIADASVGYRATVVTPQPVVEVDAAPVEVDYVEPAAMVYVSPGVEVIEDYDYPVFFSGGLYYRQEGGVWYSSEYHDRGWGESRSTPVEIGRIERPEGYVHYRANVNARVGEPGYRHTDYARPEHRSPAPRYTERPPAHRGEQPQRYNERPAQERGRVQERAPQERGRVEERGAPQERGRTTERPPQERGEYHPPAEHTAPANRNTGHDQATHQAPSKPAPAKHYDDKKKH